MSFYDSYIHNTTYCFHRFPFPFFEGQSFYRPFFGKQKLNVLNLHRLNPNRTDSVTFLPYNAQTIEHQLLTDTPDEHMSVDEVPI